MTSAAGVAHQGPWDQNPVYLAAINQVVAPGGRTEYDATRSERYTTVDKTTFIAGQADWSEANLPEVLKMIQPPDSWEQYCRSHRPRPLTNAGGLVKKERWPDQNKARRMLRQFDVLPDQICSREPGWVIEAWVRLNPKIQYVDILMRMWGGNRPNSPNPLSMRRTRARNEFNLLVWQRRDLVSLRNQDILDWLPAHQVLANSTAAPAALQAQTSTPTTTLEPHPQVGGLRPAGLAQMPDQSLETRHSQAATGTTRTETDTVSKVSSASESATQSPQPTVDQPRLATQSTQQVTHPAQAAIHPLQRAARPPPVHEGPPPADLPYLTPILLSLMNQGQAIPSAENDNDTHQRPSRACKPTARVLESAAPISSMATRATTPAKITKKTKNPKKLTAPARASFTGPYRPPVPGQNSSIAAQRLDDLYNPNDSVYSTPRRLSEYDPEHPLLQWPDMFAEAHLGLR